MRSVRQPSTVFLNAGEAECVLFRQSIRSAFVSRLIVKSSNFVISPPIISGERIMHHSDIIVICSSFVNLVQPVGTVILEYSADGEHVRVGEVSRARMNAPCLRCG